mmetsp:Transcript_28921/g.43678  ORF Transcript_28921/g.43678 Transcript_28921/m.43678 type:complete len:274 (+) Transcript_28921:215-1036(+)
MSTTTSLDNHVLNRLALTESNMSELSQIDHECSTIGEKLAYWRASKYDFAVATRRLHETQEWRANSGMDRIVSDPNWLQKERKFRYLLKYDFLGLDKYGRPVMVERVGAWNVRDVMEAAANDDDFLKLHCIACETLIHMDRPNDAVDDRGQVIIMDCQGLSVGHLKPGLIKAFGRLSSNDSAHYPDTLAHIFVVNAPTLFSVLATLIKPFMDPDTYSKVHVSSSVPKNLTEIVGSDCLPKSLGGKREGIFPYNEDAPLSDHPRAETMNHSRSI